MPKVKSRSATQHQGLRDACRPTRRPGPSATRGRGRPRRDASAQQPGTISGSPVSYRRTSRPGVHHAAPNIPSTLPGTATDQQDTNPEELPITMDRLLTIVRSEIERANQSSATAGSAQAQLLPPSVPLPPPPPSCPGYVIYTSLYISLYVLVRCKYVCCTLHLVVCTRMYTF